MRSYYAHLATTSVAAPQVIRKPVLRSSAIFPVILDENIRSRVLFMGYWALKRNIHEIAYVVTLRNMEGQIVYRTHDVIREPRTYRIEVDQMHAAPFSGSLEIEFFSTVNLFFPFPAVVLNYYGEKFCSFVHTAQRVYNDYEDMMDNSQVDVPEAGFNIYADEDKEPFLAVVNGPNFNPDTKLDLQVINADNEVMNFELSAGETLPYQTRIIYPARELHLKKFLNGKIGTAKVGFHFTDVFPRMIVGNLQHSLSAVSITHTYYDCSQAQSESDYWKPEEKGWHSAALMIPLTIEGTANTKVYFYPIYSPSKVSICVEIYDTQGHLLGTKDHALILESPSNHFQCLDLKSIAHELKITETRYLAARLIASPIDSDRIPTRIKLGLDIVQDPIHLPCNICTNLQPFNPAIESKPLSFRWSPLMADQEESLFWVMNSSPAIDYQKYAAMTLTFYREQDSSTLAREMQLSPHGFHVLNLKEDHELQAFFGNTIGWVTLQSSNPYTTTYYFALHPSGFVGGDHGF